MNQPTMLKIFQVHWMTNSRLSLVVRPTNLEISISSKMLSAPRTVKDNLLEYFFVNVLSSNRREIARLLSVISSMKSSKFNLFLFEETIHNPNK